MAVNVNWFNYNQFIPDKKVFSLSDKALKLCKSFSLLFFNTDSSDRKLIEIQNNKEVLRQLKHVNENAGNKINTLLFKQLELRVYMKELWHTKNIFNKDRLILELSRTNSFGQNWAKPIWILLVVTCLFGFAIQVINSPELLFAPSFSISDILLTWKVICSNIEIVPKLLNPTHTIGSLTKYQMNYPFILFSLDIIYKIIYAFFVFQIITAFRKFGK